MSEDKQFGTKTMPHSAINVTGFLHLLALPSLRGTFPCIVVVGCSSSRHGIPILGKKGAEGKGQNTKGVCQLG